MILFLHKKPILKIHVPGVSSSSPHHRLLFTFCSRKCIPRSFLGLSFQKTIDVCTKIKALLTKKKSHLFHLPAMIFRIPLRFNSSFPPKKKLLTLNKKKNQKQNDPQLQNCAKDSCCFLSPKTPGVRKGVLVTSKPHCRTTPWSHRDDLHIGSTSPTTQSYQGAGLEGLKKMLGYQKKNVILGLETSYLLQYILVYMCKCMYCIY